MSWRCATQMKVDNLTCLNLQNNFSVPLDMLSWSAQSILNLSKKQPTQPTSNYH